HLAAIFFCMRRQPFWCGVAAGIGFFCNAKALLVVAACAVFLWPALPTLAAGFLLPCALGAAWLASNGAWTPYIDQVWRWPALYAASPVVTDPLRNGVIRTANWLGFHAALAIGAVLWWRRGGEHRLKLIAWLAIGK